MKSYALLYAKVFEQLRNAPPFASREEAALWLRDAWLAVHTYAGASKRLIGILKNARVCAEQGWVDVDKDVCYLESPDNPPIRLFLHRDGTVVLQQMRTTRSEILLAKPGKRTKVREIQ